MKWIGVGISLIMAGWVYSDAKKRGSNSPLLWSVGVFLLWIVFLPLYFYTRPKATLCPFCGKYRNDGYLIFTVPIKDNEGY